MRRLLGALLLVLLAGLAPVTSSRAAAHPVGNLSTNRYSGIQLFPDRLEIRYVVDFAEIPTVEELARLDSNHDGSVSEDERATYLAHQAASLVSNLSLRQGGKTIPLEVAGSDLVLVPGISGLQTMRLSLRLLGRPDPSTQPTTLVYRDDNYPPRVGWGEIVVRGGDGVQIRSTNAQSVDLTNELRSYPPELLANPPDQREATVTYLAEGARGASVATVASPSDSKLGPIQFFIARYYGALDPMNSSIAAQGQALPGNAAGGRLGPMGIALALLLSSLWGAAHALSPGHGKTVVAAYLVGSRGTARHALYLGLTVTATHTFGIYALGLTTLLATHLLVPELIYPWLALLSSLAVLAVGGYMLVTRTRALVAGGDDHHDHSDAHHHYHDHSHDHGDTHDHGHSGHTHMPPGANGERVGMRSLLALGVAGGIQPCPSALVLLLACIAVGQVAFGLIMVAAFSVGLAGVLTSVGIALVYAGQWLSARMVGRGRGAKWIARAAPAGSAALILLVGLVMTIQALGIAGLARL